MEGKMDGSVQSALMDRLLRLPTSFFRNYTSGDLAVRASGIDAVRSVIAGGGVEAALSLISASYNLLLMFWYSGRLAFVAIGLILIAVLFTATLNWIQLRHRRALLAIEGKIAGLVFQFVSGIAKLRVSGSEDRAFRVWARNFAEQRRISYKVGTVGNFSQVFNAIFSPVTSMIVFWCLVFWLMPQKEAGITPGKFVAFMGAFGIVLSAALSLSSTSLSMMAIIPLYERLKPIITAEPEVDEAKSFPGKLSGAIEVSHVNFRYRADGPLVLKDISLSIKPGEFLALAGPSGCGKSTILRLLLGFEKPETGSISYDGQDVAKLDVNAMRHQMGVVLQQSALMPGDIFRNIVGMHENGTMEQAWEAAAMAGIDVDIKQMPMEMHTVISQGGSTFSGGQRQRLMIARAIFGKPRILFFDEATSALDNRTQQIVTDSLDRMQATRIVVAHRLSTIVNADRIIVVDKGQIAQQGTYQELMQQGGPFAELAKRQIA
jgi:NHLM bacteriocin system ABC transporter ATP-binding protein